MTWNHRVIRRKLQEPWYGEEQYAIHEVYYDDDGNPEMCTMEPTAPVGTTMEQLKIELERFTACA